MARKGTFEAYPGNSSPRRGTSRWRQGTSRWRRGKPRTAVRNKFMAAGASGGDAGAR